MRVYSLAELSFALIIACLLVCLTLVVSWLFGLLIALCDWVAAADRFLSAAAFESFHDAKRNQTQTAQNLRVV